MAKLTLQQEWKMWIAVAAIIVLVIVYLYLASRPPTESGEYLWRVTKVIDEQNLDLRGSGSAIRMRLPGLKIPPSEAEAAKEYLSQTIENQWVRIKILKDDPKGLKEGFVYYSGDDIIARMVRQGLAEVDRSETVYDVRPYIELEQEAKREKKGLWRQSGSGAN